MAAARAEFAAGLDRRLETMRLGLAALARQFRADDAEGVYRATHALRGTAASYGAQSVSRAAGELERLALKALRAGRFTVEERAAAAAALSALEAAVREYQADLGRPRPDTGLDRLAVVGQLATLINTRFDLQEIFRAAIVEVRRVLEFRRASVVLLCPGGAEYSLHTLFDSLRGGFIDSPAVFPSDRGLTGEAIRTRRAIRVDALPGLEGILAQEGHRVSAMIVPLQPGGEVIGTLNFGHEQEGYYTEDDLAWATLIGRQVETALYYSKLFSTIDRQRSQLEALIEASAVAIMFVGADGKVAHANRAMARLAGIPREAVLHADVARIHELLRGSFTDPAALASQERALAGDEGLTDQVELDFPTTAVYRRAVTPVRDPAGGRIGHLVVFRDVTREVEVDRLKSEFVSIVSHELRTPMTSVKTSLSLLLTGAAGALDPEARELLEIALRNTDRLIRLVNDLLDLSRIEAGRLALHPEPVSLDDVVRFSVESVAAVAGEQGVCLVVAPPAEPALALGVRDRLVQVVVNLLANAIKFSPRDSRVQVRWWHADEGVLLEVADEGPGIPRDKVQAIFEPFRQLDSSATRERGGAGLGLAITRGIVEALAGRVWVESEEGRGSRFLVRLPRAASAPTAPPEVPRTTAAAPPAILLVHSDADWRRLAAARLGREGWRVVSVAGGQAALEELSRGPADLLVTGLELGDMHGLELLERLGRQATTFALPTIVVAEAGADSALAYGAAAWTTPDAEEIVRATQRLLAAPRRSALFLVEDDPGMRQALAKALRLAGYACCELADARDALAAARARPPRALITDVHMPGTDGLSLLREWRADPELERVPVLILTGHAGPQVAREARRLSARLLIKPVDLKVLLDTVGELV